MSDTAPQPASPATRKIGPDRVSISEETVVIEARHEMPDWTVREFYRIAIYFEDRKYMLRERRPARAPFAMRYVLVPWPENDVSTIPHFFVYDEAAVMERERHCRMETGAELAHYPLLLLSPVLGLLWSETKEKLSGFGLNLRTVTALSLFFQFVVVLMELIFWAVQLNASVRTKELMLGGMIRAFQKTGYILPGVPTWWVDALVPLLFFIDMIVRYTRHAKDDDADRSWGFLEWVVPSRRMR